MSAAVVAFDEVPGVSLSWEHPDPGFMRRAGHAVVVDGRVWVIDPPDVDGLVARVAALGEPAGVLQLLDRHPRDCAALAASLGVPLYETPFNGVPDSGLVMFPVVKLPVWKEVGLWVPSSRVLVVPESLSGADKMLAPGDGEVGVHVMRRFLPPGVVRRFQPEHLLMGHGPAIHGADAVAHAIDNALSGSVWRVPSLGAAVVSRGARGQLR